MGTEVLTNKKYDYICRYRPKASGSGRDECREIYLSRQQAALLTLLHRTKSFPVFRLMNMYDTSHVYAEMSKDPFYVTSDMETDEEILESSEDLRYLCGLGLLEMDFRGVVRLTEDGRTTELICRR